MKTQLQMYREAERQIAAGNELFLELVDHPTNPITRSDLEGMIKRRPERWGRFAPWLEKLK